MTDSSGRPFDRILSALQERAKELNCLYRIDELLAQRDKPLEEIFQGILEAIPAGWQHTGVCRGRITYGTRSWHPTDFRETPWRMSSPIPVHGREVGRIDVVYLEERPRADEGPFLKEERRLLDTIAERTAQVIQHRELRETFEHRQRDAGRAATERRPEWWIILDFLRMTDKGLLVRIARRMINHLNYSGVREARDLLQAVSSERGNDGREGFDNRPAAKRELATVDSLTEATFRIAAEHMSEKAIVSCIQKWIKEDNISFLSEALETQDTPLAAIAAALERYGHTGVDSADLSLATQVGLRVSLVRRLFTDRMDYISTARKFLDLEDFHEVLKRTILPAASRGKLGGKSAGLVLASKIIQHSAEYAEMLSAVKMPKTWYLPSDVLLEFIHHNDLEDVYNWKYLETDQIRQEYPHIVQVFKNSSFPPEILQGLSAALDDLGERPLIVRSSSLLEDRTGSAFSGKYKSLFLANRGTKSERLAALTDAIAEVYASVFGPDPIEYRAERGLLDHHEEMGIMMQEVVGTQVGRWFLPAFSGVAFSNNEFRWSPRIKREDGLLRLVPGLGTRAVDRVGDDYPVLIAPGQPGLRANVTMDEVVRYSPAKIDAIDLETNAFETVPIRDLLREAGDEYPILEQLVSICERDRIRRPVGRNIDFHSEDCVFTFDGLVHGTEFVIRMRALLRLLREAMGTPVDVEFAHDGRDLYLLQCRPQSFGDDSTAVPIPRDIPEDRIVFTGNRYISNGRVPDLTHIVYVDSTAYGNLATLDELREVGRVVGRLNKVLPKRQFVLMGPGRWGSRGDVKLGVGVTYADINNTSVLIEIARKKGNYVPDLSFGTHFFQDLVEASIRYLPLYPDDDGVRFNEAFLTRSPNILPEILPDFARMAEVVRVIDVPRATNGLVLRVLMNADLQEAVGLLAPPGTQEIPTSPRGAPGARQQADDHWRWRLRFAERIASCLDPARFGVKAVYVFGSTKNATAGPGSDIDLIVHVDGTDEQRRALERWLEGWSLCLAEINYLRTGYPTDGLLDVHYVTDEDVKEQRSYAAKIGAVTDAARPLPIGTAG